MRTTTATRRRRAVARRCTDCGQLFSLETIHHPAGLVIRCRRCGAVRRGSTAPARFRVGA